MSLLAVSGSVAMDCELELRGDELSSFRGEDEDVGRSRGRFDVAMAGARERVTLRLLCAWGNERNNKKK